ncbi:MAG: tetratricopeptide repeat protein [Adhaeribacter sp.]
MKKVILTAAAVFSMQLAFAQNSAVTNASLYLKNGTLDKAKTEIDKAVVHEKTANSAKAWFTKGEIYSQLVNNPIYSKLAANAPQEAFAAYDKAISLDKPGGTYATQAAEKKKLAAEQIYVTELNAGVKFYQDQKFDEALASFERAQAANPKDTTAYQNAAIIAEQGEKWDKAKQNYRKLIEMGHNKPAVYNRLVYIAKDVEKNDAETLKVLEEALKAHPNNKDLMLTELDMYIKAGKGAEAIGKLENAIKADPNNVNLYVVLGQVYDQTKKPDLAQANYEKALKIEPANANANFNLGVLHYNKGYEINKKLQAMNASTYSKNAPKLKPTMDKHFKDSLPYFEAAMKANPSDASIMDTVAKVYLALGRNKDAEAMNKKADAIRK